MFAKGGERLPRQDGGVCWLRADEVRAVADEVRAVVKPYVADTRPL